MSGGDIREAEVVGLESDGRGVGLDGNPVRGGDMLGEVLGDAGTSGALAPPAREGGKIVFIEGALPGERVRHRVIRRRRSFDESALVEVLRASQERVEPRCAHFGICGGCSLQHLEPAAQLRIKQEQLLDNLRRIGKVQPEEILPPLAGPAWHYRRRARLGIKLVRKKGRVLAGFRERHKPYIADLRRCEVIVEPLADLPAELAALVETLAIRERVPQVEVAAGDEATALVFRVLEAPGEEDLERLREFGAARRLRIYLQTGGLDTVRPIDGAAPPLSYTLDGGQVRIEFEPIDFIQVNAAVNAAMVDAALRLLDAGSDESVLDLFCGLGNFTLPLARRAGRVTGVEGDAALVARARANAARHAGIKVEFHADNLFEPANFGPWADRRYDRILLDPPRAGAVELLARMPQWRPRRVVYISCHPGSLARDADILVNGQGLRLTHAGVMDMFPHTTHVESIAVFEAPS